jgi:hypothetical protein
VKAAAATVVSDAKTVASQVRGKQDGTSSLSSVSTVISSASDPNTTVMVGDSSTDDINENEGQHKHRTRGFWSAAPSWLISTVVHVAAILALAAWNIEPIQKELKLMLNLRK